MADTIAYLLVGGPCDQRTVQRSPIYRDGGIIICQGARYQADNLTLNPVVCTFLSQPQNTWGTIEAHFPGVFSGWTDLQRTINRQIPALLKKVSRNILQANAILTRVAKRG